RAGLWHRVRRRHDLHRAAHPPRTRAAARAARARPAGAADLRRRRAAAGDAAMNAELLPLGWAGIIAFAVVMYVLMDGFDLGVGILFPLAPSHADRDTMMNSVAPVWDGNETWLVLGGAGLLGAFPLAYSILLPAVYLPVIL